MSIDAVWEFDSSYFDIKLYSPQVTRYATAPLVKIIRIVIRNIQREQFSLRLFVSFCFSR